MTCVHHSCFCTFQEQYLPVVKVFDEKRRMVTSTLENGDIVVHPEGNGPGSIRGDSSDNDWYVVSGFHLTYILAPGVVCPKFR